MSTGAWAALALATACFASFSWAMQRFFVRATGQGTGPRLVTTVGALSATAHVAVLTTRPSHCTACVGAATILYAVSLGLFWSAIATLRHQPLTIIFAPDEPVHLVTAGPYRWIRHPLYTSYSLAWVAGVLASRSDWLVVTVVAMVTLYVRAARAEEAKFAGSALASEYSAYSQRTGRFVPRLEAVYRSLTGRCAGFDHR